MKNLLQNIQTGWILALLMVGIQSCTNDAQEVELMEVNFTATLPADARSRSFGNGTRVNTLVVGVFDAQYKEIDRKSYSINGTSVNVSLPLIQSQTYHFVFWAYDANQDIYDINDLKSVKMKDLPNPVTFSLSEAMDAFWAVQKDIVVMGNKKYSIGLVRPLAQINVGTTGIPMLASFAAKDAPDTFHPFTNDVSGETVFVWNFVETTTEKFTADGKEYNYLAMGYVFAPPTAIKIATELTLTEGNKSQTIEFPLVEVEANKRSNIAGKFTAE